MSDRLQERAAQLAGLPRAQRPAVDALLVRVQGETYAAPLRHLRAVLPVAITPLPLSAAHVAGVQAVRGQLVGVVRADVLLTGRPGEAPDSQARVLLTADLPGPCGVLVDGVGDLIWAGPVTRPATFGTPGVAGFTGRGLACLNLARLLQALPAAWPGAPPDPA